VIRGLIRADREFQMVLRLKNVEQGPSGRRPSGLELQTQHVAQSTAMCGPACLRIVCAYFGLNISESKAARLCRTSLATGTTGRNLVRAARELGFGAKIVDQARFAEIERWLRRGVPAIVDWMSTVNTEPRQSAMACGHYSVVCGLDREYILLQDPAVGRRRIARRKFLKVWFDFQSDYPREQRDLLIRRMIVVAPRDILRSSALS
jgi:ABC-type bacteriocin/lantibiotic exporter with double-glycine peptidase domain